MNLRNIKNFTCDSSGDKVRRDYSEFFLQDSRNYVTLRDYEDNLSDRQTEALNEYKKTVEDLYNCRQPADFGSFFAQKSKDLFVCAPQKDKRSVKKQKETVGKNSNDSSRIANESVIVINDSDDDDVLIVEERYVLTKNFFYYIDKKL